MENFNVTPDILDKIKRFDLRIYLKEFYDVKFEGTNCCCPHPDHDDHHPSFSVWTKNGYYFWCCHSCHIGKKDLTANPVNYGNDFISLLRWLSDYAGSDHILTFQEAALKACQYIGIDVSGNRKNKIEHTYFSKNKAVAIGCNKILLNNTDNIAYQYLVSRGLDNKDITDWILGYNGNRIVFPLLDRNKNIVAFSNRIIGKHSDNSIGKYINSKTNDYFQKGSYLYGIHLLDNSLSYAYITEGQMDVIGAYKYGMKNVLASLGTAFTEKHLETLRKYNNIEHLIFVFDKDDAGEKALTRSIQLARKAGYATSYIDLPDKYDLFDYALEQKEKLCIEIDKRTRYYFYKELEEYQKLYNDALFGIQNKIIEKSLCIDKQLSNRTEKVMLNSYLRMSFGLTMEK